MIENKNLPSTFNLTKRNFMVADQPRFFVNNKLVLGLPFNDQPIPLDDPVLNEAFYLMGLWAKEEEKKRPDYEIEDAQLSLFPATKHKQNAELHAQIVFKRRSSKDDRTV